MALIDNLVSYWKLDEASGNALDAHGSSELTETSGTIASATGKIGNARDFEAGDTEYFERADNTDLSAGDTNFTIAFWCNAESLASYPVPVSKGWNVAGTKEYAVYVDTGVASNVVWVISHDGTLETSVYASNYGTLPTSTWVFVVVWHDATNNQIGIAINAGTPNTTSHTTGVYDGAGAFRIGASPAGASYWDGLIDEMGFWRRVLTSDERTALYNGGNGLAYPFTTSKIGRGLLKSTKLSRRSLVG